MYSQNLKACTVLWSLIVRGKKISFGKHSAKFMKLEKYDTNAEYGYFFAMNSEIFKFELIFKIAFYRLNKLVAKRQLGEVH